MSSSSNLGRLGLPRWWEAPKARDQVSTCLNSLEWLGCRNRGCLNSNRVSNSLSLACDPTDLLPVPWVSPMPVLSLQHQ